MCRIIKLSELEGSVREYMGEFGEGIPADDDILREETVSPEVVTTEEDPRWIVRKLSGRVVRKKKGVVR